jgi:hypothetical protein
VSFTDITPVLEHDPGAAIAGAAHRIELILRMPWC